MITYTPAHVLSETRQTGELSFNPFKFRPYLQKEKDQNFNADLKFKFSNYVMILVLQW